MSAAEGAAPRDHAVGVDPVDRAGVRDGGAPVGLLGVDVEDPAWLTGAVAPPAVVEHERGEPGLHEPCGVGVQAQRTDRTKAVGHDDDRRPLHPVGPVQPRGTRCAVGIEGRVLAGVVARRVGGRGFLGHRPGSIYQPGCFARSAVMSFAQGRRR